MVLDFIFMAIPIDTDSLGILTSEVSFSFFLQLETTECCFIVPKRKKTKRFFFFKTQGGITPGVFFLS